MRNKEDLISIYETRKKSMIKNKPRNQTSTRTNPKNRGIDLSYLFGNFLKSHHNTMRAFILWNVYFK